MNTRDPFTLHPLRFGRGLGDYPPTFSRSISASNPALICTG